MRKLLKFTNLELRIIAAEQNFHAKGYLFHQKAIQGQEDNYTMIIGSSNLTQTALTFNREWNVQLSSLKNGALIKQMQQEFEDAWQDATVVDEAWITAYEKIYCQASHVRNNNRKTILDLYKINPNKMQTEALKALDSLRKAGKNKALLISATGTGKTYLSAFDVKIFRPKRFLFLVHRELIARNAKASYERVLDPHISTGIYSGTQKDTADYLFATIQTLTQEENLHKFAPNYFDYIVIDEAHRTGADTYKKLLEYFKPKFLLGMTATPERTDGFNIFKHFGYNIAYEIRLNQALHENMLVPFHYHGISEIIVDGKVIDENVPFNKLVSDERVKHILHYSDFYGYDGSRLRALVFCSHVQEAEELAKKFNEIGRKAQALNGNSSEKERKEAIERLESEKIAADKQLEFIFTVDIFNEGIDIPSLNQIIMLRPTKSTIIFVQQLGRGLRKCEHKRYLEVLDFIGNYENNFLLPIALYGDRSYNRDHIRKIIHNNFLPGASTVHFEDIVEKRIFESINNSKITAFSEYKKSYNLVKFKIGRTPMMMDFVKLGDKDPYVFVQKVRSYYNFKQRVDFSETTITKLQEQVLQFLNLEICNGKRLEEIVILKNLLAQKAVTAEELINIMYIQYGVTSNFKNILGAVNLLNQKFF